MMLNNFQNKADVLSPSAAQDFLASSIEADLQELIQVQGNATLVLTGGQSIKYFFSHLKKIKILWYKIVLLLSDDRIVSSDNIHSNENLICKNFLNDKIIKKNIQYLSIKKLYLNQKILDYEKLESALKDAIIILSMGADGHVASLFNKDDISDSGILLKHIPRPDFDRISLSYQVLLQAKKVYIIIYGQKKIEYYTQLDMENFYLKDLFLRATLICVDDQVAS